jgi:signal transduction histidine kinase
MKNCTRRELEDRVQERAAELDIANRSLRELSARLLQSQDDERRRIARELPDSGYFWDLSLTSQMMPMLRTFA